MTPDELMLAAHQIGMYKAMRLIDTPDGLAAWRAHNRAAAELREKVGPVYQPYKFPNRALVKAAYNTLQEDKHRPDFVAVLSCVMGKHHAHTTDR